MENIHLEPLAITALPAMNMSSVLLLISWIFLTLSQYNDVWRFEHTSNLLSGCPFLDVDAFFQSFVTLTLTSVFK